MSKRPRAPVAQLSEKERWQQVHGKKPVVIASSSKKAKKAGGSLANLDEQIAALERELASDSDSSTSSENSDGGNSDSDSSDGSSSDSSNSDGSSSDSGSDSGRGGGSRGEQALIFTSLAEERIAPLSAELLPAQGSGKHVGPKARKPGKRERDAAAAAKRDAAAVAARGGGSGGGSKDGAGKGISSNLPQWLDPSKYEPSQNKKLYCRVCQFEASTVDELREHRQRPAHIAKQRAEQEATYCKLCSKQFTSILQLAEHRKGRWHKQRSAYRNG